MEEEVVKAGQGKLTTHATFVTTVYAIYIINCLLNSNILWNRKTNINKIQLLFMELMEVME